MKYGKHIQEKYLTITETCHVYHCEACYFKGLKISYKQE